MSLSPVNSNIAWFDADSGNHSRGAKPALWTEERTNLVTELWKDGHSAGQIEERMGGIFTRSAILGKVNRLGLSGTNKNSRAAMAARKEVETRAKVHRSRISVNPNEKELPPLSLATSTNPVTIFDLNEHHCRWPLEGDGVAMLYCGDPKDFEIPYCCRHQELAYAGRYTMPKADRELAVREARRNHKQTLNAA